MPGRRCVLEDHGNDKNDLGISIHNSPESGGVRLKWKSFMFQNLICARSISQRIVFCLLFQ